MRKDLTLTSNLAKSLITGIWFLWDRAEYCRNKIFNIAKNINLIASTTASQIKEFIAQLPGRIRNALHSEKFLETTSIELKLKVELEKFNEVHKNLFEHKIDSFLCVSPTSVYLSMGNIATVIINSPKVSSKESFLTLLDSDERLVKHLSPLSVRVLSVREVKRGLKSPPNPFQYLLPILPNDFLGRQSLLDEIVADMINDSGDSHAIIAGRRCGKSSLLSALAHQLRPTSIIASRDWRALPLLFDFKHKPFESEGAFFAHMLSEVRRRVDGAIQRRSQDVWSTMLTLEEDWFQTLAAQPILHCTGQKINY